MEDAWLWRIRQYGSWVAACVAAVLAYLAGFDLLQRFFESQEAKTAAANAYLVALFAFVVTFSAVRQWNTIRKERYAIVIPNLHQLFHELRNFTTYLSMNEPKGKGRAEYERFVEDGKIILERVLNQLNVVFMTITRTHCRTCIKVTYQLNGEPYLHALARDTGSKQRSHISDNKRVKKNHDRLADNKQYADVFKDDEDTWYFFSNDLTRGTSKYQSTSLTAYDPNYQFRTPPQSRWETLIHQQRWPLPYKSKIACAIRQPEFDLGQHLRQDVLGLLIVDSESRGVFMEKWDVQLMLAIADTLYNPLRLYLDAQDRADKAKSVVS